MSSYDGTLKILLLSDPEVDKSGMFPGYSTYFSQQDDQKTIGVEFMVKTLVIDKKRYKLQLWDIGREERFRFLLPTYCLGANAALLLYDITKPQTLNNIGEWANIVRQKSGDIPIMLVGIIPNKRAKRVISGEEGIKVGKARNLNGFLEIDARTGENVGKAYETITKLILAKRENAGKGYKTITRLTLENKEYKSLQKMDKDLVKSTKYSKRYYELKSKVFSPKMPSKSQLAPPPSGPPGVPAMDPQGKEMTPDQIINSNFLNWDEMRDIRWIYCQKCNRKFTKEEFFTHSCKKKPSGPKAQRSIISSSIRGVKMKKLGKESSRRAQSEKKSRSESDSQFVSKFRPITTAGAYIDPQLKGEVQSFLEWIKDSEGLSGYINYYLQQNNTPIISELSKIYSELRKIFGV